MRPASLVCLRPESLHCLGWGTRLCPPALAGVSTCVEGRASPLRPSTGGPRRFKAGTVAATAAGLASLSLPCNGRILMRNILCFLPFFPPATRVATGPLAAPPRGRQECAVAGSAAPGGRKGSSSLSEGRASRPRCLPGVDAGRWVWEKPYSGFQVEGGPSLRSWPLASRPS